MQGLNQWEEFLVTALLVMVRLSGLLVFAPFFSSPGIPARVKIFFAVACAYALSPVVIAFPHAHPELGVRAVLGELAIGLLFGLCLSLFNEMLVFAGQIIGMQLSFSLVNLLDPNTQVQTPLIGELFSWFGVLVILGSGLHRTMLAAFMRTFAAVPVGSFTLMPQSANELVGMVSGVFLAAIQLSAPVLAATLLVELAVSLMGKLSPQLPVMSLTVPMKTVVGYVVMIGALALWPHFLEGRFNALLDSAGLLIRDSLIGTKG